MTRFAATVVVVDEVEVVAGFVVVVDELDEDVEAAVVSTGEVDVVTADVDAPLVAAADDAVVSESEEHARTSCDATSSAHHDRRCITKWVDWA